MADFPLWNDLELYQLQGCKPQTLQRKLVKAAREFLPYPIYWSCGDGICKAPYGDYFFAFVVEIEQERRWNTREFQEGRAFAVSFPRPYPGGSPRDANPYKFERSRKRSWDCGYILGLSEREE